MATGSNARAAALTPDDLTVEGRLYDNAGAPVNTTVDFKLEVLDEGNPTCVLYGESRPNIELSSTDLNARGVFSLRLGAGTVDYSGQTFAKLFAPGPLVGNGGCGVTATATSHRRVRVSVRYNGAGSYEVLGPDTSVTAVPLAKVAENALTLEGMGTASFLALNGTSGLQQTNLENLFTLDGYAKLMALVAGTSTQYQPQNSTVPYDVNSQRIINLANPTNAQDAVNKTYADSYVGGKLANLANVGPMTGNGLVMMWDGTANKWVAGTPDKNPTGAAGGDLTGSYPNPTIANNAISSAKINSTGIAVNRLLMTDSTTGTTLTYPTCATNEVLAWTASGWACTAVATLAPVTSVAGKTGAVILNAADIAGLGTAALKDVGTTANTIPQLDASGKLPALDGKALINVDAFTLRTRSVASTLPGTGQYLTWNGSQWEPSTLNQTAGTVTQIAGGVGIVGGPITSVGTLSVDVGSTANKIVQLNAFAQLPTLDGSLLTQINAIRLQARPVATIAPTLGQVLAFNTSSSQWEPTSPSAGSVISVGAGTGLLGGPITTTGSLSVDVGTGANKIVQLNTSAQLPGLDGSLLTQVNAVKLLGRALSTTTPGANQVLAFNTSSTQWEPRSAAAGSVTNITASTGLLGGSISNAGTLSVDVGTAANKIVQLNASAQLPAVDGSLLTQVSAVQLQGRGVATVGPTSNQVLVYNGTTSIWEPKTVAVGSVTYVGAGTGLTGGPITTVGSLNVDVGVTASKIVQLTSAAQLPAVDGSLLTQVNASKLQSRAISTVSPTAGQILVFNTTTSQWEPVNPNGGTVTSVTAGTGLVGGTISTAGTVAVDVGISTGKIPQVASNNQLLMSNGSISSPTYSFGAATGTGVYAPGSNSLAFSTNSAQRVFISSGGLVGIGTNSPAAALDIAGTGPASALVVPRGTESSKPTALSGMIRYNMDRNVFEGAQSNAWKDWSPYPAGSTGDVQFQTSSGQFGASAGLNFNGTTGLTVNSTTALNVNGTATFAALTTFNGLVKQKVISDPDNNLDCGSANVHVTPTDCSAGINLTNVRDGATYTVIVTETGTTACGFSATGYGTIRYLPPSDFRVANSHTVYSVLAAAGVLYVNWTSGFAP